jgi:basic membrane protein A
MHEMTHTTPRSAVLGAAVFILSAAQALAGPSVCQVTDTGGVDDRSFNETAWRGVKLAEEKLGATGRVLESQAETDYEPNVTSLLGGACDIIITVGFLMGDTTEALAKANPNQLFSIVDYSYDPPLPNVIGQLFSTDEAAFLAGYLSAGMTQTGTVGLFGGLNIPPVTIFMDGYVRGVEHYNAVKGTEVKVIGWDPEAREGLFTNNFDSVDDGRTFAQSLYEEGADIVLPVAGTVGLGSAALADEIGTDKLKIIGVDADLVQTNPNRAHVYLTSIMKRMDQTVLSVVTSVADGSFKGGVMVGTLANGGVDLAPYHTFADDVPAELAAEIDAVRKGIIDGSIDVSP